MVQPTASSTAVGEDKSPSPNLDEAAIKERIEKAG